MLHDRRKNTSLGGEKLQITVARPTLKELELLGVKSWPIWTCDVSSFDWHYDNRETCYILEGRVTVDTAEGSVFFGPGDLVVFPVGLDCIWNVHEPIRKHYRFG